MTINRLHVLLLNRIGEVGQNKVAEVLKVNESTVTRIKNGEGGVHLSGFDVFLDTLGLKVVEKDAVTIGADELAALKLLAGKYICGEK